jgi:hypothetical protein
MKIKNNILPLLIFTVFIGAFFVLNLALPDRDFSQQENRALQKCPAFSLSALFSGSYTSDYEKYSADQFALRDMWMPLKARAELLVGKTENNGVYYCGDTLIKQFKATDTQKLEAKVDAVNTFASKLNVPVYFGLIPGASDIWHGKLPQNAPNSSQKELIGDCYSRCSAKCIDIYSLLQSHSSEDIYYRTDHHWTSLGAYYGYEALSASMGYTAPDISTYDRKTVTNSFCGTNWSSSGFTWVKPDSIETFVDDSGVDVDNYSKGADSAPVQSGLYAKDFLDKKDKYSYFMGGVTPLLHVKTENSSAPSLLIIRDSYTDSLLPFLTQNYSDIYVIDLRYFRNNAAEFAKDKQVDSVLILYSVSNFCTDDNIVMLGA